MSLPRYFLARSAISATSGCAQPVITRSPRGVSTIKACSLIVVPISPVEYMLSKSLRGPDTVSTFPSARVISCRNDAGKDSSRYTVIFGLRDKMAPSPPV